MSRLGTGLAGKVVVVTGAAHGIGEATARLVAGEGAHLIATDLDAEGLHPIERLDNPEGQVLTVTGDVSKRPDTERIIDTAKDSFGRLDALIHCAGIYRTTPLPEVTDDEWEQLIDVNLRSTFLLAQGAVELMKEGPGGAIVLFGSYAARTGGLRASAPYAASKAGVEGVMRNLAAYAGPFGIRVNCIHPGFTETAMTAGLSEEARSEAMLKTPLRRSAPPEDQATMAVVLISELSRYVHGVALDINGGMYMA